MGTITGSIGSAGSTTYFNQVRYLNCSCPAGYYPTQITFNDIKSGGAWWKNNSSSAKILDIHLVDSAGTLQVANIMRLSLTGNGTDSSTKTTKTFDGSGYAGQGIYIIGGNATGNVYLQNGTSVTVTTAALSYTLTTSAGTGGSLSASPSGSVATGTTVTLTPSASTGYTFSGYTTSPSVTITNNKFTMPASNLTVTANFTKNNYTLTTAVSPSGYGSVTAGGTLAYGATKSLTATPGTGRYFSSWSKTSGSLSSTTSNPTTFTMGAGNATVTANFGTSSYTLTTAVSPTGGGTVTAGGTISYGGTKSLTATAATGYTFSNWSKTSGSLSSTTSNPTTFTMGAGNATVTANFTHNTYTLSSAVTPSGGGTVTLGKTSAYYNESVSITAVPSEGYAFAGWTITGGTIANANLASTTITMPNNNATVTALFVVTTISSFIQFFADDYYGGVVSNESQAYEVGETIDISASENEGYQFTEWTATAGEIGNSSSLLTTYTIPNEDATVKANFIKTETRIPVKVGDITCTIGSGSITLRGNFIDSTEIVSPITSEPAVLILRLGVKK